MTATATPSAAVASRARRLWRIDALALGAVAIVLRLPAFFADRSLVFDDGVYASSALAMRNGLQPFRDVFSSQGPVFLPLVWLADLLGFRTLDAPRLLTVASGVLLTIAVYSCARRVTTRGHALLAAGLVTTSGSVLWVTGPINADGPSLALSVLAIALALRALDHATPRLTDAVWVGLAGGAAASIKALSVPAIVIAGVVLLLARRRVWDAALAAAISVCVYLVTALPWGLERMFDQSFTYHNDARRLNTHPEGAWKVVTTLWERDLPLLVALALALGTFLVARFTGAPSVPQRDGMPRLGIVVAMLGLWAALVFALLVWEPALFRAHVAQLVPPLALLASVRPPPWMVLLVAAVVLAPFWIVRNDTILWPRGYRGAEAAVVHRLQALPGDALVISDDPGLAWRAGHAPPGNFADPSFQRIEQGRITERTLVNRAAARDVCGVVVSSRQHFGSFENLGSRLAGEGYRSERFGDITVFTKAECRA
jgi:4-amino-4-deoxy-L-arabinose transferase-like glycosyltransferase